MAKPRLLLFAPTDPDMTASLLPRLAERFVVDQYESAADAVQAVAAGTRATARSNGQMRVSLRAKFGICLFVDHDFEDELLDILAL